MHKTRFVHGIFQSHFDQNKVNEQFSSDYHGKMCYKQLI